LHVGWSVEGSIGTDMKIDALYISADTQITNRVEDLNDKYETSVLMTGELYDLLSEKGQAAVKCIDHVIIN